MRKVILYIAVSLDGYIADEKGGVEWTYNQCDNSESDNGYKNFIKNIDTVIMGYNTYNQIVTELSPGKWVYKDMKSYVLTHRNIKSCEKIEFVNTEAEKLISELKSKNGSDIWICGGADIINQLMDKDIIEEYHLSIIPVILGNGIRLFNEGCKSKSLKLVSLKNTNGIIECILKNNIKY